MDRLAETIAADNGKTRTDSLGTEVLPAIAATAYYCKKARSFINAQTLIIDYVIRRKAHLLMNRFPTLTQE